MTDPWRVKRYYRPRVLLEQDAVLDPTENQILLCLDGAELAVIRTMLAYAHRRVTWVAEYREADYVTPTNEDFDTIQAIVANLEEKLMTGMCEEIVTQLAAIDGSIQLSTLELERITAQLTSVAGDVPDMVTALECICAKSEQTLINLLVDPDWPDYPGAEDNLVWGDATPDTTVGPQIDEDACKLAQAWYQAGFEFMTERLMPAMRFGFDKLVPAAAAAIALWTGGVGIPVAIGVYAFAELVQELIEVFYEVREVNLENWLFAHKEDIVCPLYFALKSGGSGAGIWAPIKVALVDPAPELSVGEKLLVNWSFSILGLTVANAAKAAASPWYTSIQVPGYCETCEEPPVVGSDWVAMPVATEDGLLYLNKPTSSPQVHACWAMNVPAGFTVVGWVVRTEDWTPGLSIYWKNGPMRGCGGSNSWTGDTTFRVPAEGNYNFVYEPGGWDHVEAKAALCPGYTTESTEVLYQRLGPMLVSEAFETAFGETGTWTGYVTHVIYLGTTPPPEPGY